MVWLIVAPISISNGPLGFVSGGALLAHYPLLTRCYPQASRYPSMPIAHMSTDISVTRSNIPYMGDYFLILVLAFLPHSSYSPPLLQGLSWSRCYLPKSLKKNGPPLVVQAAPLSLPSIGLHGWMSAGFTRSPS